MNKVFTILLLSIISFTANAQNISNKGKEFWVGYGHHQFIENGSNTQNMVLYLSAEEQPATVTVTIDSSGPIPGSWWRKTYNIPAYTVIATDIIPKGTVDAGPSGSDPNFDARLYTDPPPAGTGGAGIFRKKGIHITSNVPIVAYAHIYGSTSSGATMLLPVDAWGYSYVSVNSKQEYQNNCYNWVYVIAGKDNTVVEITPSVLTRAQDKTGLRPGLTTAVTLMKGQIYQVIGANEGADANGNGGTSSVGKELTGTKIRSLASPGGDCYPIAVFAGSSRTSNPASCGSGGGDNDNQQLFPQHAWGKKYLTAPFSGSDVPSSSATSIYKIAVKDPATVVRKNGTILTGLINNSYYTYESSAADYIEADKPILVVQFMTGGGCLGIGSSGDPEMVVLSPLEQAIKRVGFFRNNKEAIGVNYVTLVLPTAGIASLLIGGSNVFSHTYPHPRLPGYTVVIKRWASPLPPAPPLGQCIITCDSAFNAITYGLGSVESYAYSAGAYINNLNGIGQLHNEPDTTNGGKNSHLFNCVNTPVKLSVLMRYKPLKLVWEISSLGAVVTPNTDITLDPASSAYVDSVTVNGNGYYRYTLPGTYTFNTPGIYNIPIQSTSLTVDNCNNTEEISVTVEVRAQPGADFTFTHPTGCVKDTVYFLGPASTGSYTMGQWQWSFPDGTIDSVQNPKKLFTTPGTPDVQLRSVSSEGCVAGIAKPVTLFAPPTAGINPAPAAVCEGGSILFSPTASYGGPVPVNTWYWDLGNGTPTTVNNNAAQSATYQTYGDYTTRLVVRVSDLCTSDTAMVNVPVYAKPRPGVDYPAGCLPASGIVQFTDTSSTPDGQAITGWDWNFGDPASTPANNVSTLPNPTHAYTNYGNYDIAFSVTSANGCTKDTIIKAVFNVKPQFTYPALLPICASATGTVSVAGASVTNGVAGTGIYKGPGTDAAGNFNPVAAGSGTHTIWYVFTSTAGCIDSVSQTIAVSARPKPGFTYPAGGCLPIGGLAQFTNTTTITDGQSMNYSWNFGDPNATPANPNTSTSVHPTHNYTDHGTYPIKLTITTSNGCTADTTIVGTFSVKPQLAFAALPGVCESIVGTVSVAKGSVTNSVTGTGMYKGPGTDAAGNFTPSTAGTNTHTIWYIFTSAGGCIDSVSQTIVVYPKPSAVFTVNNDICLDQSATITDQSVIASGNIATRNWDFGNGTNASYANGNPFSKSYSIYNTYTVKLTAVSDNGCTGETSRSVAVHPLPVADFDLPASICMPGGNAVFTNRSAVADHSALSYQWNFGDGSPASSGPSHNYPAIGTFNITLTATSAHGCAHDTIKVLPAALFFDKPVANFTVAPDTLCQGSDNVFTDLSTPANIIRTWNWNFGDGSSSDKQHPTKRYANPGNYHVTLTVTNTAGCIADPLPKEVVVYLQPVIDAGPSFVVPQGTSIQFNPTANDSSVLTFRWTPGTGLSDQYILRPTIKALRDERYLLKATGQGNCTATDELTVKILRSVKIPNAFSPNGDGINDRWTITNLADYPGCTIEVFNRYGQRVYFSTGYANPWNGTYNGKPLPLATYYYVIHLKNGFNPETGSVTILR